MALNRDTQSHVDTSLPSAPVARRQQMIPRQGSQYVDEVVWNLARVSEASDFGGLMFGLMSVAAGHGVSTLAANVALRAADYGRGPVLLVECDLQRPVQQRRLQVTTERGLATLSDFLLHGEDLLECIRPTKYDDLHLLAIPERSVASLDPLMLAKALSELRMRYPMIVLDLPPAQSGASTMLLASQLDGVVLVIDPEATSRRQLEHLVGVLRENQVRMLGTVLNRCRPRLPRWLAWLMGIRDEQMF